MNFSFLGGRGLWWGRVLLGSAAGTSGYLNFVSFSELSSKVSVPNYNSFTLPVCSAQS
uniref:Uncharacterized protein n=1 Tax=Anguilla anguilla TaxID=7936 RepID=A0A0E9WAB6_ANGAN